MDTHASCNENPVEAPLAPRYPHRRSADVAAPARSEYTVRALSDGRMRGAPPTAEPIDARRALACNLVSRVVGHETLVEEAEVVARQSCATRSAPSAA